MISTSTLIHTHTYTYKVAYKKCVRSNGNTLCVGGFETSRGYQDPPRRGQLADPGAHGARGRVAHPQAVPHRRVQPPRRVGC